MLINNLEKEFLASLGNEMIELKLSLHPQKKFAKEISDYDSENQLLWLNSTDRDFAIIKDELWELKLETMNNKKRYAGHSLENIFQALGLKTEPYEELLTILRESIKNDFESDYHTMDIEYRPVHFIDQDINLIENNYYWMTMLADDQQMPMKCYADSFYELLEKMQLTEDIRKYELANQLNHKLSCLEKSNKKNKI